MQGITRIIDIGSFTHHQYLKLRIHTMFPCASKQYNPVMYTPHWNLLLTKVDFFNF